MMDAALAYAEFKYNRERADETARLIVASLAPNPYLADALMQAGEAMKVLKENAEESDSNILRLLSIIKTTVEIVVHGAITVAGAVARILARILANPYVLAALALGGLAYWAYNKIKSWWDSGGEDTVTNWVDNLKRFVGMTVKDIPPHQYGPNQYSTTKPYTQQPRYTPTQTPPISTYKGPGPSAELESAIDNAARSTGIRKDILMGLAKAESNFGRYRQAKESSASGAFQITKGTWKAHAGEFGLTHRSDENDALFSAMYIQKYILPSLRGIVNNPGPADIYAMYVFGPTGGKHILQGVHTNPNAYVAPIHSRTNWGARQVSANYNLFYDKKQGGRPRTYQELYNLLQNKVAYTSAPESVSQSMKKSVAVPAEEEKPKQLAPANNQTDPTADRVPQYDLIEKDGKYYRVYTNE